MISIFSSSRYRLNRKSLRAHTRSILTRSGIDHNQTISIAFVGRRKMKEIAREYKGENIALPVLIFPYEKNVSPKTPSSDVFAEVVICYPQAVLLASQRDKTVDSTIVGLISHAFSTIN